MAFLLPALLPALSALGLGALTGLGAAAAKKVVGDAVPEDQIGTILSVGLQNPSDPLLSGVLSPQQLQSLSQMRASVEASPEAWFTRQALSYPRGTGMQLQPVISNHGEQVNQSQISQNIADAAALQQLPSTQMGLLQGHNVRMNPHQAISAWDIRAQNPGIAHLPNVSANPSSSSQNPLNYGALSSQPSAGQSAEAQSINRALLSQGLNQAMTTASTLSIHPQTNLAIAPQPINKLMDNQGVVIPAPSAIGGINPQAPGVAGIGGSQGVATAAQSAGNALLNTVKEAASGAASGAIHQIGGQASSLASQGLKKAGSWLGNFVSSGLTNLAKKVIGDAPPKGDINGIKVVGDAPPPYVSTMPGFVGYIPPSVSMRDVAAGLGDHDPLSGYGGLKSVVSNVAAKVVGDAPPGGDQPEVMTEEQTAAAVVNLQESVIFNLMSRIVLNEQVFVQSTSMPIGLNELQLNNYFARDLEALVGTYRQSEVQTLFGLKGMAIQPNASIDISYDAAQPGVVIINMDTLPYVYCTGVALEAAKVAPPLTTNETLTRLAPLLAGAALGEYSSQLRIKTFSTDVDLMMRATAATINNIQSQTGYSFCLPLVKAMGYLLSHVALFGDEMNQIFPDMYWSMGNTEHWEPFGRGFPLSPRGDQDVFLAEAWQDAELSVISDATYIKAITGLISTTHWGGFDPSDWGVECAVVFVPQNDAHNAKMNAVRMAMQMGYPIELMKATGGYHFYTRDGRYLNVIGSDEHSVLKNSSCVYIPGPYKYVLFVVLNSRESAGVGISLGDGVDSTEGHLVQINAADHPPNDPYVVPAGATAAGRALRSVCNYESIPYILAYIKEWEYSFGNASDRSSAMRFWADHAYRWNSVNFVMNGLDIGDNQTISFHTLHKTVLVGTHSAYRDYSDIPLAWEAGAKFMNSADFALALETSLTSTYMCPAKVTIPDGNTTNFSWTNGSAADGSRLPLEDPMVTYLVLRRWVTCNEEYPEVQINDPARLAHTICVMANIMALAADLSAQQSDFHFSEIMCAPWVLAQSPTSALRQKNVLWPALEQILTNGIQYPQYWNNRDVNFHRYSNYTYWNVSYPKMYPTSIIDTSNLASVSRIPMSIAGQWFKPLYPQYIHLRLNLREMKPQRVRVTIGGIQRLMYQCFISEEQTGLVGRLLAPISWLAWRLTLGVLASTSSQNYGFKAQVANNTVIRDYMLHFEQYDAGRNQVIVREFHSGGVTVPPTTAAALPTGEFIIKRSIADALQPVSIIMQGPQDAFIGVGVGSTAYQLFVQTNTPQALYVSESWATVPDWLFSERGLMSDRDTI